MKIFTKVILIVALAAGLRAETYKVLEADAPGDAKQLVLTVGKSLVVDSPLKIQRVSVANGDNLVGCSEVAHPRVGDGEEVRDHRRGKWIGLFLQVVERGLHLSGAVAKVSEEGGVGTHQRPRQGRPARVLQ